MINRRCPMCDEWYSSENQEAVERHKHPEPQSGAPRDAWLRSGLSYEDWIKYSAEGRAWVGKNFR